ncbi:cytochrome c oxidase assembly protein [Enterovirga sp.]|jgi:cytochrome c oxidase assembly protein subunit 11|uniref:cytochrome c oxidase assembly protein n=1 Tax=Enterovirga sp. TaxID=2026350 RepID=UPI00263308E0|nr:cytochrome c oxidase assembly protein [Enterovirga sp.]MDB5593007.1 cytochrome c oxidase assembly protein [Enterovirga sp.]
MTAPVRIPTAVGNQRARRLTLVLCGSLALAMVGAAYAAVPLYDLFCRVTGFDGTPVARSTEASETLTRTVKVRFDSNVAPGLGWSFSPELREIEVRIGETQTVFFRVKNEGTRLSRGVATYNVQPGQAGAFFVKMKCFCFDEQALAAGETMDFPVVFYIDPALTKDRNLDELSTITLSYTYFASRNGAPVASTSKPQL